MSSQNEGFLYVVTNEWLKGLTGLFVTNNIERDIRQIKYCLPGDTKIHVEYKYENFIGSLLDCVKICKSLKEFAIITEKNGHQWFQCPVSMVCNQIEVNLKNKKDFHEQFEKLNSMKIQTLEELGEFCNSWRKKNSISQEEMADLAGLDKNFIYQLENGTCNSEISDCLKIISLLGFDLFVVKRSK